MAKKKKQIYQCTGCGHQEPKWLGRCPSCGEWNTFVEVEASPAVATSPGLQRAGGPVRLTDVEEAQSTRRSSGIGELDRVLGGGIMSGASVLIGGEPGIGKSTLMLQMAAAVTGRRVLYISGEESAGQIRARADRLGVTSSNLEVLCETDLSAIMHSLNKVEPTLVVVDSIQTLHSEDAGPIPGTVNQIKYCCFEITEWARNHNAGVFLVAHVTKEGSIAGPKLIEHMVDTVLYFEQSGTDVRFLRSTKNRFGATEEVGLFSMAERGLEEVTDPASVFLVRREGGLPAGVVAAPVYEGSRILLVELQALTVPAKSGVSRTFSDRIDASRVSRIAAVLEKHVGLRFSDQDVYVNVAGGMRITEVGVELPLALALYSARTGLPLPDATIVTGEVSLAGEIRPVAHLRRRIRTAREMGYSRCIGPAHLRSGEEAGEEWQRVATISDSIAAVFGKEKTRRPDRAGAT